MATMALQSSRGKHLKLVHDGYSYTWYRDRSLTDDSAYRCDKYKNSGCKAKAYLSPNGELKGTEGEHICGLPDRAKTSALVITSNIKERAAQSQETTRQIFQKAIEQPVENNDDRHNDVLCKLPSYSAIQKRVQRVRSKSQPGHLPNPNDLTDLHIPPDLQSMRDGKRFLLHDTGEADTNRIIIFATDICMAELKAQKY